MDNVIALNGIIFFIIIFFIIRRYRKYHLIQLNDFLLILYSLFFPLSLLRPYLGYESIIGYNIFNKFEILETCSIIVFFCLLLFILGYVLVRIHYRRNKIVYLPIPKYSYSSRYIRIFKKVTIFCTLLSIAMMVKFIMEQGSFLEYMMNIESIRQTLTGQMGNYTLIYLTVLISLYLILITEKFTWEAKTGIFVSIILFVIYGFRGPIISILIILFFILQKLNLFRVKINVKNILIILGLIYLFVLAQDLRSYQDAVSKEPFFVKLLTRFFGYEPLMVVYDKVILQGKYTINTLYNNFLYFIELPIPRTMMDDKIKPVSIIFTDELFYDEGDRSFATGGISPTILGSLIWNFHYIGIIFMVFFSMVTTYVETRIRIEKNNLKILVLSCLSLYLVLAVEYPENFLGVLWMLMISYMIIFFIHRLIYKKQLL